MTDELTALRARVAKLEGADDLLRRKGRASILRATPDPRDARIAELEAAQSLWREMSSMTGTAASDLCAQLVAANWRNAELEAALREIRDQEWVENCLDPQWAARIARRALGDAHG